MPTVTIHGGQQMKLGRIRPRARPNALRLGAYFDISAAVTPRVAVDYYTAAMPAIRQVLGNDQQGDCTIASIMHRIGTWVAATFGTQAIGSSQEALSQYHQIGGPGDNGLMISDVLDWAKSHGFSVGGQIHKIDGYVSLNWTNKILTQVAVDVLGGATLGVALPQSWASSPDIWDVTNSPIVGGHDIPIVGYNNDGVIIATWGGIRTITWAAFLSDKYVDEAYVCLGTDWYANASKNPNGIDIATLRDDMNKIQGGTIPPLDPVNPPWNWSDAA
jgi:hypothetical protein